MSYDLRLLRLRPGEDIADLAMRDDDEGLRTLPDAQKEALKRRVADALLAADPRLMEFKFDYGEIAKLRKISREQAERDFRHIELDDDSSGLQIMLFDDEAGISVPYWHEGAKAESVFQRMLAAVALICRETGYVAFDPQIEEVVSPEDLAKILPRYIGQVAKMPELVADAIRKVRRPWWKLW